MRRTLALSPIRVSAATLGDAAVFVTLLAVVAAGVSLAGGAPRPIEGPAVALSAGELPRYAGLSFLRMLAAYGLSLLFALAYGSAASRSKRAERVMLPVLDILQSVPILSFLPVVALSLTAVLPTRAAVELAAIVLIFTSQSWNLTFAWYQSLTTIPGELREAARTFQFSAWTTFRTLHLPFAANNLIWNSVMSWAGGWFFLMAAESFSVNSRDFRLPGLGSYLKQAADAGDVGAIALGLGALVLIIVALDQLAWRPLLAWADRFKLDAIEGQRPPTSWFLAALRVSPFAGWATRRLLEPAGEWLDRRLARPGGEGGATGEESARGAALWVVLLGLLGLGIIAAAAWGVAMLARVPAGQWLEVAGSTGATLLRVIAALVITLAWTVPAGVAIGSNPRLAAYCQPVVQILASVPATAVFPAMMVVFLQLPGQLSTGAVLLMLLGTQWYVLFSVIAGASSIPQDLRATTALLQFPRLERWRTLILPALFPYLVTGAVTASGGAWNASIVAEHVTFREHSYDTVGLGALIARATDRSDYPLLLASTLAMIVTVVTINRLVWRRLYRLAERRFRLE
ncbi:MAG: ABC transporter permease subunit [Phycisphaerales bacterium]|nr:ABC transporter permease subunit [Phycisphaerales bacterium]